MIIKTGVGIGTCNQVDGIATGSDARPKKGSSRCGLSLAVMTRDGGALKIGESPVARALVRTNSDDQSGRAIVGSDDFGVTHASDGAPACTDILNTAGVGGRIDPRRTVVIVVTGTTACGG